jgi:hypothetical protein
VFGAGASGPGWGNGKAAAVAFARAGAAVAASLGGLDILHNTVGHAGMGGPEALDLAA